MCVYKKLSKFGIWLVIHLKVIKTLPLKLLNYLIEG